MSLQRDGVWKGKVWASTVWAQDVWFEIAETAIRKRDRRRRRLYPKHRH